MTKLSLKIQIVDPETGKVDHEQKCHSWTFTAIKMLCAMMQYASYSETITDTGGTARSGIICNMSFNGMWECKAAAGTITRGIVVGTGTNAEAATDYALQTPINHGTSAGQLSYGAVGFTEPYKSGSSCYAALYRSLQNSSGGNITVNEVAWYGYNGSYYFCIARDKLSVGVTINNGATKTVQYVVSVDN